MKEVIVISLGGSQIFKSSSEINVPFLNQFKKIINKNTSKYKFVVVTGGGIIARTYISGLEKSGINDHKLQSMAGISVTRTNARFLSYFFKQDPEKGIPHKMRQIKRYLKKQDVIFCGALEYKTKQTTDATSAQIAAHFKAKFINITNVNGLYDKDPKKFKNAKLIKQISWNEFDKLAKKIKFHPGQHFILDQTASEIIKENKITTKIIGTNLKNLDAILKNKPFTGTIISE